MDNHEGRIRILVCLAAVCVLCLVSRLLSPLFGQPQETDTTDQASDESIAAIITCYDTIDEGLADSIMRRGQEAIDAGADYLILDVQTYGGRVDSADEISKYLIQDLPESVRTVAYVKTEAISAGSMISVSCEDIIMRQNTTIGCSAPILSTGAEMGQAEREKIESFVRSTFSRAAEANGYPKALLEAMVSQKLEVWQVKNRKTGKMEYFENRYLPTDPNAFALNDKKLICAKGELLTLTANEAKEYGIARAVVANEQEMLKFLEKRDGVTFSNNILRMDTMWSEELVRWLNSPAVVSVLILGILLGIYVEFNTPGLGIPSLLAIVCLVILVGGKYLTGMANWLEIALLGVGFLLLMAEIFVIPGFGVAGFAGIVCLFAGLLAMLVKNAPDEVPWPDGPYAWQVFMDGLSAFVIGFLLFIVVSFLFARYIDRIPFLNRFVLKTSNIGQRMTISETSEMPRQISTVDIGQEGRVVTPLRPAGRAKFGGSIIDVVADGAFIEKDKVVRVLEIHGNRVVVGEVTNRETA